MKKQLKKTKKKGVKMRKGKIYGYIRVSSKEQSLERQFLAFDEYAEKKGFEFDKIFYEKASGRNFNRPEWKKLLDRLGYNDVVVIKELDRMGRNMREITENFELIVNTRGAFVEFIDQDYLNTKGKDEIYLNLVQPILFKLLSYIAESELKKIKQRQKEGYAALKTEENKFGRVVKIDKKGKRLGATPKIEKLNRHDLEIVDAWIDKNNTIIKTWKDVKLSQSFARGTLFKIKKMRKNGEL